MNHIQCYTWQSSRVATFVTLSCCLLLLVVLQSCPKFASCAINDVSWHSAGSSFAAATEQGQLLLQDIRTPSATAGAAAGSSRSHVQQLTLTTAGMKAAGVHVSRNRNGQQSNPNADCLTVDFDPNHPHRLATGGSDGYVYVLDMRRLEKPLDKLSLHAGDVRQVSWSRGAPGLLASAGEDGHALLWDVHKMRHSLRKQQQRQQQQQQQGTAAGLGPQQQGSAAAAAAGLGLPQPRRTQLSDALAQLAQPGLLFAHHGHIAAVGGLAWNPDR
jgi:WD40 repeat protein